jgi:hypothetical protein
MLAPRRRDMAKKKGTPESPSPPRKKPLDEPEKLSPIPGAPPPEEPQVDEELSEEEKEEYRRAQQNRTNESL